VRIYAYLRVVADEAAIRAIHEQTNVPRANVKQLKAQRDTSGDDMWWHWVTESVDIDADDTDGGLKSLLSKHREIFPVIRKCEAEADIYLEVVTQYEKGENVRGLFLSAETILLLSELGGALDNDVYGYEFPNIP
jgi:ADP-ribose pyrophosphatase YjhB (NUDIX family)